MANKDRDKHVWFVPKRANVHQMLALLHGIIIRGYDGTTWNTAKQDNLNLELKKLGATRKGGKLAPQGMRTLLASLHYLGFVYLDNTTTPTTLKITKAGYKFYSIHKDNLKKIDKLSSQFTINQSESVLAQMSKLQITNPIILPHCEDIYVFPFRVTLAMLRRLNYLDMEEIAMFVFHTHDMSEIEYKISEIINFRKLDAEKRSNLVNQYKQTIIGNLTLNKAPSAGYFMAFCVGTGIIEKNKIKTNAENSVASISIKKDMINWVDNLLDLHKDTKIFDFGRNLDLWISYFGTPERQFPPTFMSMCNHIDKEFYIEIFDYQESLNYTNILNAKENLLVPVFENEEYTINIYNINNSELLISKKITPTKNYIYNINTELFSSNPNSSNDVLFSSYSSLSKNEIIHEILKHSSSKDFSQKMLIKLNIIHSKIGIDKRKDKSLRGAQYEYLFYLLLTQLKESNIIDEVIWNGKIGKYNLPTQAPGGKNGTSDIIFIINNVRYILELTTIKSKSAQFTAEGSAVPDHIKLYKKKYPNVTVKGIFCAPIIHDRVHITMNTILSEINIPFISIDDANLLEIFNSTSKQELISKLDILFK